MRILSLLALLLCLTAAVGEEKKTDDKKTLTDQEFVTAASAGGLAEINISRLAVERASKKEVKDFAQQMVRDHSKANEELLALVNSKRLMPAAKMDAKHEAIINQLTALKGSDFDQAYVKAMVDDHQAAIVVFEAAHLTVPDKDLKAFAAKTLPVIKVHQLELQGLNKDNKDSKDAKEPKQ